MKNKSWNDLNQLFQISGFASEIDNCNSWGERGRVLFILLCKFLLKCNICEQPGQHKSDIMNIYSILHLFIWIWSGIRLHKTRVISNPVNFVLSVSNICNTCEMHGALGCFGVSLWSIYEKNVQFWPDCWITLTYVRYCYALFPLVDSYEDCRVGG